MLRCPEERQFGRAGLGKGQANNGFLTPPFIITYHILLAVTPRAEVGPPQLIHECYILYLIIVNCFRPMRLDYFSKSRG